MLTPLVQELLEKRGIFSDVDKDIFLKPEYVRDIHDPYLLPDIEKATTRILDAIQQNQTICIYSDYDCDGIPGAVVLTDFFNAISYKNFFTYIPDRHSDGYGLNMKAIDEIADKGATLIITIDLGITATKEVAYAMEKNIDVIITDHHIPHEILPDAFAIVNPKRIDSQYPFRELCGAGVIFKVVQALAQVDFVREKSKEGFEKWMLDMVALATLSDMVPLVGENRALVHFGLLVMKKNKRPGLASLLQEVRINPQYLSEDDITFLVTPRINAASRMDDPMKAYKLLSTSDILEAETYAKYLSKINNERKTTVATIMKEAHKVLSLREEKEVIVLGNPSWRPGILGLVASRVSEQYERPVFVWGGSEEGLTLKGSCRSDGTVNMVTLMQEASHIFESFGGHELAGGFEISRTQIHELEEVLIAMYNKLKKIDTESKNYSIDMELPLSFVKRDTAKELAYLSPFGLGNPKPLFLFRNVEILSIRQFGKAKEHLEIIVTDGTIKVTAMNFFTTSDRFSIPIVPGNRIQLIGHIETSFFLGSVSTKVRIVDII